MEHGRDVLGLALALIGALIAVGNLAGVVRMALRRRRGAVEGYTTIPLVSLLLCGLAWLLSREAFGAWLLLPALLDPANAFLVALPFYLWRRAR